MTNENIKDLTTYFIKEDDGVRFYSVEVTTTDPGSEKFVTGLEISSSSSEDALEEKIWRSLEEDGWDSEQLEGVMLWMS